MIIGIGIFVQVIQYVVSIKDRKKNLDTTGDPFDGRTLEWSTSSPPPIYNFAVLPTVYGRHPFWDTKYGDEANLKIKYEDIHMPKNTSIGFLIAGASFIVGFSIVWHIFWLTILAMLGIIICIIVRSCDYDTEYRISKDEVIRIESLRIHKPQTV